MKISIITVVLNHISTIRSTIESVLGQTHPDIEYIIIDGGSTDGSKELIESYGDKITKFISEPDDGMYDALNKGIRLATGEIIGSLNADDIYTSNRILETVAATFKKTHIDSLFADLHYVRESDLNKTVRYYSGKSFTPARLRFGFMPPHPTFFVKKTLYEEYGYYKTNYHIAADFELIIRFLYTHKASYLYLPMDMIRMTMGGKSTNSLHSKYILNREIVRGCRENGIYTNMPILVMKYFIKVFELFNFPTEKMVTRDA